MNCLAIDLGAGSGRAMVGQFDGSRVQLSEVHRFPNGGVRLPDGLHWDALRLWSSIRQGIQAASQFSPHKLSSLGLDTWGLDFALLDKNDALLGNPYHYRDNRTDGMLEEAFRRVPKEEIYEKTGIQLIQLNSLYQLLSMVIEDSPQLDAAETYLMMPDLFNFWLTGEKVSEFSEATTSQCYDPRKGDWAWSLLKKLKIPTHIFPEIVPPGTVLGELRPWVAEGAEGEAPVVIAPGCHDTASAVAAVPAEDEDFIYISSGTWSLIGAEIDEPIINEKSLRYDFTNEGGLERTFRFLKNIDGMWLLEESRRAWASEGKEYSYGDLTEMAAQAPPLRSLIDPDDDVFLKPGDMPARIRTFCRESGQPVPETEGSVIRCALESLALKYRWVTERLEEIRGRRLEPIHIVGGGSQNGLLNQFTADATGHWVVTGPVEATATGNVLAQLITLGQIGSMWEGREIVRQSFDLTTYEPTESAQWDDAYGRFLELMEQE